MCPSIYGTLESFWGAQTIKNKVLWCNYQHLLSANKPLPLRNCRMRTVLLQCLNWCPAHGAFPPFRSALIFHSRMPGWYLLSSLCLFLKGLFFLIFGLCIRVMYFVLHTKNIPYKCSGWQEVLVFLGFCAYCWNLWGTWQNSSAQYLAFNYFQMLVFLAGLCLGRNLGWASLKILMFMNSVEYFFHYLKQ